MNDKLIGAFYTVGTLFVVWLAKQAYAVFSATKIKAYISWSSIDGEMFNDRWWGEQQALKIEIRNASNSEVANIRVLIPDCRIIKPNKTNEASQSNEFFIGVIQPKDTILIYAISSTSSYRLLEKIRITQSGKLVYLNISKPDYDHTGLIFWLSNHRRISATLSIAFFLIAIIIGGALFAMAIRMIFPVNP